MKRVQKMLPTGASLLLTGILVTLFYSGGSQPIHQPGSVQIGANVNLEPDRTNGQKAALAVVTRTTPNLVEALERPLFSETRRNFQSLPEKSTDTLAEEPHPPETVQIKDEAPKSPSLPSVEFKGFVKTPDQYLVLVRDLHNGSEEWFKIGEEVQGWTINSISEEQLTFQQNNFEHVAPLNQ